MKRSFFALASTLLLVAGTARAGNVMTVPQQFPTIQAAVEAAQPGDSISISEGIYRENVTIATNDITLLGRKVTIDGAYAGSCVTVHADDVTLDDLIFVNGGPATADAGQAGGLDYVGAGAVVTACEAQGCANFGLRLQGSGTLVNNTVSGCLGPGVIVQTVDSAGPVTSVLDNTVYRCTAGLDLSGGPFVVDRDLANNNSGFGLHLTLAAGGSGGASVTPTAITRTRSLGNGGTGLQVDDTLGALRLIQQCVIQGNDVGVDLASTATGLQILDNNVQDNRGGGIFLKVSGADLEANHVGRNSIVGIVIGSADGAAVGSNTLTDNRIEDNGGDGFHVVTGGNVMRHNYFKDNVGDGLQVVSGASANQITDNMVRASGNDGIDNWGSDTLISDNTAKDSTGADLAGIGDGQGTVDPASANNTVLDGTGLTSKQELELNTLP